MRTGQIVPSRAVFISDSSLNMRKKNAHLLRDHCIYNL
jgi:hypothetical protein